MPRLPRLNLINVPQHIIQTGHNRLACFFDEEDYDFYLRSLHASAQQYSCEVHAYVLLENMVQIIATPKLSGGISSMMQSLGRRYVQYVNHRYRRSGTLWGGRYKSSLIDSEAFLLSCYRYVELRPLNLGLVEKLEDYRWSSFGHHSGSDQCDWIIDHHLYMELGETREDRCNAYNQLFRYSFDNRLQEYIAETISMGQILGGDKFKDEIERISQQRVRPLKRGRPKKNDPQAEEPSVNRP